ncbi:MAG TPA: PA0069 family radical SAM protein [Pirellulales bacterium]|jgi:DNA repair photolyase|nr:PA0069 family radical SAM protein [Pirellulales bacterium]
MQPPQKPLTPAIGRGAQIEPPNRFEKVRTQADWEQLEHDELAAQDQRRIPTQFFPDKTCSLITHNDSPDIPFVHSINPYRGCEHGCAYCYARPGHEYLGMNAGLDFETKVLYKPDAARLLRAELCKPSWKGTEVIAMSGVTDCYQPAERRLKVTRSCLEVLVEARQAFGLITKNALVLRDLDLLAPHAKQNMCAVNISVTTLDADLARDLEPRTSPPAARLRAIKELSSAGVPVRASVAPVIPGLTDVEIPSILEAVAAAGACGAGWQMLRLPWAVRPIFEDWLARNRPLQRDRVIARIKDVRGGKMNDYQFGRRMRGQGEYADGIAHTFRIFRQKFGLDRDIPPLDTTQFRRPRSPDGQLTLF